MKITQQTMILAMAFLHTASVCAQAESPNLLRNGSFEAGRYGWMLDARPLDATFTVERNRGVAVLTAGPRCQKAVLASEWLPLEPAWTTRWESVSVRREPNCRSGSAPLTPPLSRHSGPHPSKAIS